MSMDYDSAKEIAEYIITANKVNNYYLDILVDDRGDIDNIQFLINKLLPGKLVAKHKIKGVSETGDFTMLLNGMYKKVDKNDIYLISVSVKDGRLDILETRLKTFAYRNHKSVILLRAEEETQ